MWARLRATGHHNQKVNFLNASVIFDLKSLGLRMLSIATLLTAHSKVPSRFVLLGVFSPWLDAHYAQKERGPRKSVPKEGRAPQKSTRQTFAFVYPLLRGPPTFHFRIIPCLGGCPLHLHFRVRLHASGACAPSYCSWFRRPFHPDCNYGEDGMDSAVAT
jgi:hypothetical protein